MRLPWVWMGQDVFRGVSTLPQTLNRYAYVRNNPITLYDFYGFWDKSGTLDEYIATYGYDYLYLLEDFGGEYSLTHSWWGIDDWQIKEKEIQIAGSSILNGNDGFLSLYGERTNRNAAKQLHDALKGINPSLGKIATSLAADCTPVVGSGKSFIQVFTGYDIVTGEQVNRFWETVGIIPYVKFLGKGDKVYDIGKAGYKFAKHGDDLTSAKNIEYLLKKADDIKLPSSDGAIVVRGDFQTGKNVFQSQTKGWSENVLNINGVSVTVRTSADGKYKMNFRNFSSSDNGEKIKATIDIMEYIPGTKKKVFSTEIKFSD